MFLIYINDLIVLLSRFGVKVKLFVDDARLYVKVVNVVAIDELQRLLQPQVNALTKGNCRYLLASVVCFALVQLMLLTSFILRM